MTPASSGSDSPRAQGKNYRQFFASTVRNIRWSYAAIAFCLAVTLWYTVTVRDKVETWVDVNVQFKDTPSNLIITEGLINKLAVRVRVARGLSRSLTGRDASMVVDLSSITRGSNAIAVTSEMLPFTSAYEVVEMSPSRILIVADNAATREIELGSRFEGKLGPDLFVKSLVFDSRTVQVSGAEALFSSVSRITIPIALTSAMPKGTSSVTVAVPMPANVTVTPPQIKVDIEIGVRTSRVKLVRDLAATGYSDGRIPSISPGKATIVADIPETLAKDRDALATITAFVPLPPDMETLRTLPVSVQLPENAELVSVTPANVTVTVPSPPEGKE